MSKPADEQPEQTSEHANELRIALWPGRDRDTDPTKPYLTGKFMIGGQTYFCSLWKRDRRSDREPILSGPITMSIDEQLEGV